MLLGIPCPKENCDGELGTSGGAYSRDKSKYFPRFKCNTCKKVIAYDEIKIPRDDLEILIENVKLSKKVQHFQDSNRIERKSFREFARIENSVGEFNLKLIELLEKIKIVPPKNKLLKLTKAAAIIQLADLHLNELISELFNKFDFTEASKRLKLYITKAKMYLNACGVNNIILVNTGDILNSDRRLDEMLNQATNRSKATLLTVYLLEQVILDLLDGFKVTYITVTGNESRIKDEIGYSDIVATDNYDFTVYMILERIFKDVKNIEFSIGDPTERVINICGQNVLFIHGSQLPNSSGAEKAIQQIIGKYALHGTLISYVLCGHFHAARIGDNYARSSALSGSNAYSDKELQLAGRASQNIFIFWEDGNHDGIKIDLQCVDKVEGYDIKKELEAYNAKSAEKIHHGETILKIVI
jgi:predicted phosphodiesterase